jgi:hypothetical protein
MGAIEDARREDAELRALPGSLWDRLRADPARAPEYLALAAAERHGPAAAQWAQERRAMYAVTPRDLALMAKKRHAGLARYSGAAGGVGGFVTLIPDLAAAAWVQSRLVFFVAAAYGFDPLDPMRPAEQLVLQGLYADAPTARRALDGAGTHMAQAMVESRMGGGDEALAARLAKMVGKRAMRRMAGRLIPGFAIAFNAIGNERDTRALGDRAIAFYGGEAA